MPWRVTVTALCACLLALCACSSARAACPDTKPSYTSACGPLFTMPQWSDASGWDQPSSYSTIQLANVDGAPGDELVGRDSVGVWVEHFDPARGQFALLGTADGGVALSAPDTEGWNRPEYYETLQTADLNGDGRAELLLRGKDGLHVYGWNPETESFEAIAQAPFLLPDSDGWNLAWHYQTIQSADVDGDGKAELLARGPDGLRTYRWNDASGRFEQVGDTLAALADFPGEWYWPGYYQTIQTADVDGDGKPELLARGGDGLHTWKWTDNGWVESGPVLTDLSDGNGWDFPQYWRTIQTADVDGDGHVELLARGSDGLHTWKRSGDAWISSGPVLSTVSNANGWDKPERYLTLHTGDLDGDGNAELVGRDSAGIVVWRRNGDTWSQASTGTPAFADDPWAKPAHYETIRTGDVDGDGRTELVARGVYGMRTFTWDPGANTFQRPKPYGDFPAFTTEPEQKAYAAVGDLLLGRPADFRAATYANPSETISEATLLGYRHRLAERCQPVALRAGLPEPPRYADCNPPPGSGVDPAAWTAVSNQIIAELWGAGGVVAHFTALDTIQTKLFQDQQGSLPALDAALKLPPDVPDKAPTFIKLVKAGIEVMTDIAQLTPIGDKYKKTVRAIALTAHALGAVGEGLGLRPTPDPPQTYAKIVDEVARIQQRERDITEAQRRYVLADYGLLMSVGALVNGRLWTLDTTAMLSAGRQSFATWAYQLYTPAFWKRYQVSTCSSLPPLQHCDPPTGPNVRSTTPGGSSFVAILNNQSGCTRVFVLSCTWVDPGEIGGRTWGAISDECRYDPTPGSTNAWRYGCNLGASPNDLLDLKNGWNYPTTSCNLKDLTICKDVATLDHGAAHVGPEGEAAVHVTGSAPDPGSGTIPAGATVTVERIAYEEDGEGELVQDPDGVPLAPAKLARTAGTTRRARFTAPARPLQPRVTATLATAAGTLRMALRVQGARLQQPDACLGAGRRVKLETIVDIGYRSGRRVSEPLPATWTCTETRRHELTGLAASPR